MSLASSVTFADEQDVIQKMERRNIVLEFTADWCGYCRKISPMVSRLVREGHPIQQVDADKNSELMRKMGVTALPCFVLLVDGKIKQKELYYSGDGFQNTLNGMLSSANDSRERHLQKFKALAEVNGEKKSLDGADHSARIKQGTSASLVNDKESEGGFDFGSFGLERKEATAAIGAPAVRPEQNLGPNESFVSFEKEPISTVRIRVSDGRGVNFGTGTIISSANKKTYILSCGHIFRGLKRGSQVDVDFFVNGKPYERQAILINYDARALDLGLLGLQIDYEFPTTPLASLSGLPAEEEEVYSIGCGGGELPTRIDMQVTKLNRYEGPDTIRCTMMPEKGRSGGGLFTGRNELVGVCISVSASGKRGIYTSLKTGSNSFWISHSCPFYTRLPQRQKPVL
ncbi:MAG: thioredoxin domain-containing protein [Planctomycetaceae bacterium]